MKVDGSEFRTPVGTTGSRVRVREEGGSGRVGSEWSEVGTDVTLPPSPGFVLSSTHPRVNPGCSGPEIGLDITTGTSPTTNRSLWSRPVRHTGGVDLEGWGCDVVVGSRFTGSSNTGRH